MKNRPRNFSFFCAVLTLLLLAAVSFPAFAAQDLTILFTHDMHDYYYPTETVENGELLEHGGAARLATILKENRDDNTLYLDAGDFSMGTLYQTAFSTDGYELRNLGILGCDAATFGNHEFDYGAEGVAANLRSALASGDPLPKLVLSNIDFSGELTPAQQDLKAAFDEYGICRYTILEKAGYKIGIFGLEGPDSIECVQTDIPFTDYIEEAKKTAAELRAEGCDLIIVLSHAGNAPAEEGSRGAADVNGTAIRGEDAELARQVPEIDIIISGHSHSCLEEPSVIGSTVVVSAWEYLKYVGKLTVSKEPGGALSVSNYRLIPVNSEVTEDAETAKRLENYQKAIEKNYLADKGGSFDRIIAHSSFDTISLTDMYATHQEYTTGNLIADSYLYEAEKYGINDIDVALVGLGTIRGSVKKGFISVADAFEICSLGVGADGSAGHPIVSAYVTGKELKLLTELDASLGQMVSSIKMSYSGLSYSFNEDRILLDRVTDVCLVLKDGSREPIDDSRLYRVAANMYALNMLGMLNDLTKGILAITPKYADGTPVRDFYDVSLRRPDGTEIKEWVAFMDYLESFPVGENGVPELPERYRTPLGRKIKFREGGLAILKNPGTATKVIPTAFGIVILVLALLIFLIVLICRAVKKARKRKTVIKEPDKGETDTGGIG